MVRHGNELAVELDCYILLCKKKQQDLPIHPLMFVVMAHFVYKED